MEVTLYSGGIGINNKVAPHRLRYSRDDGVVAMEQATNVLVDMTGEIVSRKGSVLVESGDFHSCYPCAEGFYVVRNNGADASLHRAVVQQDGLLTMTGIWSGLSQNRMEFVRVGEKTYYTNGVQKGTLDLDARQAWPESEWHGDDQNKDYAPMPTGSHMDILSGCFLMAVGDEVFFSPPGLPGIVDNVRGRRRFESEVIMVCSVQTGVFLSTKDAVYFLDGTDPLDWHIKKVLNYPAVEWAVNPTLIDPSFLGLESFSLSCLFGTVNGPAIGLPDGTAINFIDKNVSTATCSRGGLCVVDETIILQS